MKKCLLKQHIMNCPTLVSLVLLTAVSTVQAQDTESRETIAAYSADYKAAFTCSATFNSNKSPGQIAVQELAGIYPAYQDVVNQLPAAVIDYENKHVSVEFSKTLPQGWAQYVATPAPAQPPGGATGYGAQFWLYNERSPNIPNDAYAAQGNRGQFLMIIPSENLIVIRRGHDPAIGGGFRLGAFTEAVLGALKQH